jgi:nitrite reductase (NADH) large subunit
MNLNPKRKSEELFMRYVIIGAGIAGVTAAKTIRELDKDGQIVIIGKESHFPYNRFLLTEYLCEAIGDNILYYASQEFFEEHNIRYRKGEYVKFINPETKTIKLFHNEVTGYDKLLIAVGGYPGVGPVLRPYEKYIQQYYSLENILTLKKQLDGINRCIVTGDNLTTLDLMCGMCNLGKKVTYIIGGEKIQFPRLESDFADEIHDFIVDKGIEIIPSDRIESIRKEERSYHVTTMHEKNITGDVIFASDSYVPNISLVHGTPIEKKSGILVDQHLRTSVEDIYAAGDCVEIYHPGVRDYWVNFGWPNAKNQGEIAGKNMAGQDETYEISEVLVFSLMGKSLKARWWG